MVEEEYSSSLEYAPTWIVAGVCSVILIISLSAERGLHVLGKTLKRNKQDALFQSLQKLQSELMLLGFISLLLTVFQGVISRICIPEDITHALLPCKKPIHNETEHFLQRTWNRRRLLSESESHCDKGKVPLLSLEALHQLHIFIFVLAVVYVVFCATTMVLGGLKVQKWTHWEQSIRNEVTNSQPGSNRVTLIHTRNQQQFKKRAFGDCNWMQSFFKQFYGSVTKSDYVALRHGFIMAHWPSNPKFDFHKYMMRTLEGDFKKVVGISWYLWAFVVMFLLVNLKGWHSFFWLSFLPLILLLLVGAKLEHVITCLAEEIVRSEDNNAQSQPVANSENNPAQSQPVASSENNPAQSRPVASSESNPAQSQPVPVLLRAVKPSDKHFWFSRPNIVLYLIHFILFQNSFEIAFLFWVLCTYGIHSCILDKVAYIVPRLIIGLIIQVLCSYSTLPLYTIVSQMGSQFKQAIFDEHIGALVHLWAADHSHNLQAHRTAAEILELDPHHETKVVIVAPPLPPSTYPSST